MRCSSLGTLMGVNPFKTAYKMFMLETGRITDEPNLVAEERMNAGKMLEATIIKMYEEKAGSTVKVEEHQSLLKRGDLTGHMDGWVVEEKCPLEIKNTTKNLGTCPEDMDKNYYAQVQGYIYLTDADKAVFCYLKNGWELHYFDVPRNNEYIQEMLEKIEWYQLCLELDEMEEPITVAESKEFPIEVVTNVGLYDKVLEFAEAKERAKEVDYLKAEIQEIIGDNLGKLETSVFKLSYGQQKRKGSLDTNLLQKDHPELNLESYRKEDSVFKVLRVALKDEEEDI